MDFRENMQVRDQDRKTGFRLFYSLPYEEDIEVSIQASYGHYCTPRKTTDLDEYETMEVAILKNNEFVTISDVSTNTSLIEKLKGLDSYGVYGFVPVDLIQEIINEFD